MMTTTTVGQTMRGQRLIWIVWPAFLVALVLEVLVFAVIDPQDLHWLGGMPIEASRTTVYSIAFFLFWIAAMASSALTTLLTRSPYELNRCPLKAFERPDGCPKQSVGAGSAS